MQLNLNGVNVTVDESEVSKVVYAHILGASANEAREIVCIGDEYNCFGGVYAGIMRGRDGGKDYHLYVGPELDMDGMKWEAAMEAAQSINYNGHSDYTLPHRAEQALMYANVPELFKKEWYWSCEQSAGFSTTAWAQTFGNGTQNNWYKTTYIFRARAVRRLPI